ncbi:MAG TPA: peptidoglycan-binding domain-containing protein [Candidatus Paceibacterota bacterium]|jgi:peptidoglycan hydrolase-like protein with peptidoglycan-binding domain
MTALAKNPNATWKGDGVGAGEYTGGPPKALLHATISGSNSLPGYSDGYSAPHETYLYDMATKRVRAVQHTLYTIASRSLRNEPGGVETNRDHTLQIELAGYIGSYPKVFPAGGFDIETAPTTYWEQVADLWGEVVVSHGVKNFTYGKPWIPANRMSLSVWDNYGGLCAHILCPENDHVDLQISSEIQNLLLEKIWGGGTVIVPPPIKPPISNTTPPTFPLPKYHYFYYPSSSIYVHSGWYSSADRLGLRTWQARMRYRGWPISVDGVYGNETNSVARAFQHEKGLTVDGKIGLNTWNKAWTAPIT